MTPIWATQKAIATLFDVGVLACKQTSHIFNEGEFVQEATVSKMEIIQTEGIREVTRSID